MKIRILGGGWYGSHLCLHLLRAGHDVALFEVADRLFSGASGGNPARLHIGPHYPRSKLTREACRLHYAEFMSVYGSLTHAILTNIYAIAAYDSLVDFGTYTQVLEKEIEFIRINPEEYGLRNCEGAILCGERHILIDMARAYFTERLAGVTRFGQHFSQSSEKEWDWTIDCTFCANDSQNIDRFEPCVTGLLQGPTDRAVTIMDGPFGSIYPWNEKENLCSLTSAKFTPLSKTCSTYPAAREILDSASESDIHDRCQMMIRQMGEYWPASRSLFELVDWKLSIRAMPRSSSDTRLVDVICMGDRWLRVRAGKIDAIFHAARRVDELIAGAS